MSKSKVLFMLSGSISAFKACQVISRLVQDGHAVQVVATPSALKFVGNATFEGLTGRSVLSDLWESEKAMAHIDLTRWADQAVLCPASANIIAKLAHGLADDLVSALSLAWPRNKAYTVFPAMNSVMFSSPATQENLRLLSTRGFRISSTGHGNLACGEVGLGRLLEPEEIIRQLFAPPKGKILITSGATREPIDGIRFVSNVSSGQTGATLADAFLHQGWQVTYLHGAAAVQPKQKVQAVEFSDAMDLEAKLQAHLSRDRYEAVIHCAAVSDYSVVGADPYKKISSAEDLTVTFKRNAKILPNIKAFSANPSIKVIGFKLTLNQSESEMMKRASALLGPTVDAVVANDWSQVNADRSRHPGHLLSRTQAVAFQTLDELSLKLDEEVNHGPMS
jgi:phosphopantothenoylcysteine decarboxylase/phosphopantothenate--cysteine ligase